MQGLCALSKHPDSLHHALIQPFQPGIARKVFVSWRLTSCPITQEAAHQNQHAAQFPGKSNHYKDSERMHNHCV